MKLSPRKREQIRLDSNSGSTWIEALVAIAMLAVLALLLIPVFGRNKAKARLAKCTDNYRQISIAFGQHADDHRGQYPYSSFASRELVTWDDLIHWKIGGTDTEAHLQRSRLQDPKQIPEILVCPEDNDPRTVNTENFDHRRSYSMIVGVRVEGVWNVGDTLPPSSKGAGVEYRVTNRQSALVDAPGRKISEVLDPSGTLMLVENAKERNIASGSTHVTVSSPAEQLQEFGVGIYERHGKKLNYLFHDGHVELIEPEKTIGWNPDASIDKPQGMWTLVEGD